MSITTNITTLSNEPTPVELNEFGMPCLQRQITSPGDILKYEFLDELGITVKEFANEIGVSEGTINSVIYNRSHISTPLAFKLAKYFGQTVYFWDNLQREYDFQIFIRNPNNQYIINQIKPFQTK